TTPFAYSMCVFYLIYNTTPFLSCCQHFYLFFNFLLFRLSILPLKTLTDCYCRTQLLNAPLPLSIQHKIVSFLPLDTLLHIQNPFYLLNYDTYPYPAIYRYSSQSYTPIQTPIPLHYG